MGLSGGADSSMALLVCVHAFRKLGYPAEKIIAVSMPGPGTSQDALMRIKQLAKAAGVTLRTIPIHDALDQHLKDIGHPADLYDISYENSCPRAHPNFDGSGKSGSCPDGRDGRSFGNCLGVEYL